MRWVIGDHHGFGEQRHFGLRIANRKTFQIGHYIAGLMEDAKPGFVFQQQQPRSTRAGQLLCLFTNQRQDIIQRLLLQEGSGQLLQAVAVGQTLVQFGG